MLWDSGHKREFDRRLGQTYQLIVDSLGGRRQLQLTLGTQTLAVAVLGTSFHHMCTGVGKDHCGIFPVAFSPKM